MQRHQQPRELSVNGPARLYQIDSNPYPYPPVPSPVLRTQRQLFPVVVALTLFKQNPLLGQG